VVGPTGSSVFIRNCTDCKFVINCKQLRLRDCDNCEIMLYSQTEPVLEASKDINFHMHNYSYPEMFEQMKKANLSIWNNKWD